VECKLAMGIELKEQGNKLFVQGETQKALGKYTRILAYVNGLSMPSGGMEGMLAQTAEVKARHQHSHAHTPQQLAEVNSLLIQAHLNIANCQLKLKQPAKALPSASKVLELDPTNLKGLMRRAKAYYLLRNYDAANDDITKAKTIAPTDVGVHQLVQEVKARLHEQMLEQRKRFAGMFGGRSDKRKLDTAAPAAASATTTAGSTSATAAAHAVATADPERSTRQHREQSDAPTTTAPTTATTAPP